MVAPPGNQAANGENKRQPIAMGVLGLLDKASSIEENIAHFEIIKYSC